MVFLIAMKQTLSRETIKIQIISTCMDINVSVATHLLQWFGISEFNTMNKTYPSNRSTSVHWTNYLSVFQPSRVITIDKCDTLTSTCSLEHMHDHIKPFQAQQNIYMEKTHPNHIIPGDIGGTLFQVQTMHMQYETALLTSSKIIPLYLFNMGVNSA